MATIQLRLFHIYIGTAYQGCVRAKHEKHACDKFSLDHRVSSYILRAEPQHTVQELKAPKKVQGKEQRA